MTRPLNLHLLNNPSRVPLLGYLFTPSLLYRFSFCLGHKSTLVLWLVRMYFETYRVVSGFKLRERKNPDRKYKGILGQVYDTRRKTPAVWEPTTSVVSCFRYRSFPVSTVVSRRIQGSSTSCHPTYPVGVYSLDTPRSLLGDETIHFDRSSVKCEPRPTSRLEP